MKMERNSKRRRIKPSETLLNIEDLGESSDDSDFRIEDHYLDEDESDLSDESYSSNAFDDSNESDETERNNWFGSPDNGNGKLGNEVIINNTEIKKHVIENIMICCVCLGDRSDDTNEIIECDGCGVTVHEGCYGVQDNASLSSTISSCSTEPWFCEACRAGITNPTCELCPNFGGIFKETDVGKWVHLVCALYIPGIAFGEVDRLSNVTLFELPSSRWGNKPCQFCQDYRFARTGITIECDAGMCRVFFHVTCGQREGLLSEATSEEVEQADPFYAHCRLHSDKNQIKRRKRNWLALQLRTEKINAQKNKECFEETNVYKRNQKKLSKYKLKYIQFKANRMTPWVPKQKRPRFLTTSASACRALWKKSKLMGIDTVSFEDTEALITIVQDIPKKWNITPAFSVEFIGYFLDRDARVNRLKKQLSCHAENKSKLMNEQQSLQTKYDTINTKKNQLIEMNNTLKQTIRMYHDLISKYKPNVQLPDIKDFDKANVNSFTNNEIHHPLATAEGNVPTAAALKAGVGFPLRLPTIQFEEDNISTRINNKCGICYQSNDQHLLTKCDTCEKFYHLGCLNPPLTRMPKKTKLMGWQCSECDKNSSTSDIESVDTDAPRKLRRSSKDRSDLKNEDIMSYKKSYTSDNAADNKKSKKRRREKHRNRYSPEISSSSLISGRHHSRKRKNRNPEQTESEPPRQGIKLFIKSIPNSSGQANFIATQSSCASTFISKTEEYIKNLTNDDELLVKKGTFKSMDVPERCNTCSNIGTNANMVRCDECSKSFHFSCLDPPVKKSPKVRGYSWHCADCDPSESEYSD